LAVIGTSPAWALDAPLQPRQPWSAFRRSADYPRFVSAIRRMKANGDAESPASWAFWPMVHMHHCPHGKDYFLAWHRGYLHLFERQLREVAGSQTLRVPYWDYFADAGVPAEFAAGNSATNPLFEPRIGGNVGAAIGYSPFEPQVTGFQRAGSADCFEARMEAFHNKIHNLVGGRMATMLSPSDPLFWVHHANVDRLWTAWAAAGQGRAMPAAADDYWRGSFDYAPGLALDRSATLTGSALGYRYPELALPAGVERDAAIPPPPPPPRPAPPVQAAPPPVAPPPSAEPPMPMAAAPAPIPYRGFWLGTDRYQRVPLERSDDPADAADEITIVLDRIALSGGGQLGGYYYDIFLDLDGQGEARPECLLGAVGPFQIAAARHDSADGLARIMLRAGEVIRREAQGLRLDDLGLVFRRTGVDGAAQGETVSIGAALIAGG
jgi:tyrosinase